jgi:hypothetical protein
MGHTGLLLAGALMLIASMLMNLGLVVLFVVRKLRRKELVTDRGTAHSHNLVVVDLRRVHRGS